MCEYLLVTERGASELETNGGAERGGTELNAFLKSPTFLSSNPLAGLIKSDWAH